MVRAGTSLKVRAGTSLKFQFRLGLPRSIKAHITTKLHEFKPVVDAGRGGWRAKYDASTHVTRMEISFVLVVWEGQTSMHRQINRQGT